MMTRQNRDVARSGRTKNVEGKVVVEEEKVLNTCKASYDKLSNEEIVWHKHSLLDVGRASGPSEKL